MTRVLLTADVDGAVGGINVWAGHLYEYAKRQTEVEIDALPARRKDFTTFTSSEWKRIWDGIRAYTRYLWNMRKQLRRKQYDVLHVTSAASYGLLRDYLLLKIAKRHRVKTILHFHFGRIRSLRKANNWEYKCLLKVARMADWVIVLDEASKETLLKDGIQHVRKIANPIAPWVLDFVGKNTGVQRLPNQVLYVGQCYKEKGVEEVIKAGNGLPELKVKLIGSVSEAYKGSLTALMKNPENMTLTGLLPYEQVLQEMLRCTVFVLPSYSEGFPNVILEAMACGCPIVATPVGAIAEMLDVEGENPCGVCVPVRDVEALQHAISDLINDAEKAKQMGVQAQKRVEEQYAIPKVWAQLVSVWKG